MFLQLTRRRASVLFTLITIVGYQPQSLLVEGKGDRLTTRQEASPPNDFNRRGSGARNLLQTNREYTIPSMEWDDIIYNESPHINTIPIVIEEYNLIFFRVAKAASSEWTRFFMRLEGNEKWCGTRNIHPKEINGLKLLSDYPIRKAQKMMLSPKWTKAMFVRNPKTRLLSAFLDKAVKNTRYFVQGFCVAYGKIRESEPDSYDSCVENHQNFDFFLRNITSTMNTNVHWRSCASFVDKKWWPYINYIANMEHLSDDARDFLKTIHSNIDGVSAWDRLGKTGWDDHEFKSCHDDGDYPFLGVKDTKHKTDSTSKLYSYYTHDLEKYVEKMYADDYNSTYFKFSDLDLFEDEEAVST